MGSATESCLHLEGLRVVGGSTFRCPACEARLDLDGVARWVRRAERDRDEAYRATGDGEFGEIVREERQREVYRRRKVLYDLQNTPHVVAARPEMLLVVYDARDDRYECRIFYKEPRTGPTPERISVEADPGAILELRSHPDPNVRTVSERVEEFHGLRRALLEKGSLAPARRVFYSSEL
jgi:hypothetical protein